eukprot:Colp12_sorted_trinity150504_noHs@11918
MPAAQAVSNKITLKGSTEIVCEYFDYAINSILYQRGIYEPEDFGETKKYGLRLMVTKNTGLKTYLNSVINQLKDWMLQKTVQKLVVVVSSVDTQEVVERWQFDVECDKNVTQESTHEKCEKRINSEIQAVIRQITASVSFLPLLEPPCTFDLLVYTNADLEVPMTWEESDPKYIKNAADVRLRSFSTSIHKIDTCVAYKVAE